MKFILLIVIYMVFTFATCKKDCYESNYSFATAMKVTPNRESIYIGDTIWLSLDHSTQFIDNTTGNLIDFSNSDFGTSLQFYRWTYFHADSIPQNAGQDIEYVLKYGELINDPVLAKKWIIPISYTEKDNKYLFEIGIVMKKTGDFSISISDAARAYRNSDKCTKASIIQVFDKNLNQHLNIYQTHRPGYTPSLYETEHMYFFTVR